MCTAIISALTGIAVRSDVAMTGEITLRGEVLPIGGLKEKLLAAHRAGVRLVLIPHDNMRDLEEIPANILAEIEVKPVKWIDEVIEFAMERVPQASESEPATADKGKAKPEGEAASNLTAH